MLSDCLDIPAACTIGPVIPPFPSIGDAFAPLGLTPRQEECVNQQIFGSRSPDFTRACSHVLVSDPDDVSDACTINHLHIYILLKNTQSNLNSTELNQRETIKESRDISVCV